MVKVFFLGGTGHIGGEVINAIVKRFPGIEITTLVRDDKKGARLTEKFSTIKTIIGDLESFDVIEKASRDAGIVINCAPDIPHAPTTHAITRGLSSSSSSPSSPPTFLIHTSGAGLTWTAPTGTHDPSPSAIWSDTASLPAILSAPRTALHAPEDAAVRAAHPSVRVAIVSPTAVYGLSASPVHPTPITLPDTVRAMRALGAGFTVAAGDNLHGWVHVADLARIYVGLLADAVAARTSGGGGGPGREPDRRLWGPEAYFFAVGEELAFREWMAVLVPEVRRRGGVPEERVVEVDFARAARAVAEGGGVTEHSEAQALLFGAEMRCRSDRARELLGWVPRGEGGVRAAVGEVVDVLFESGF